MSLIDCREAVARMWAYLASGLDADDESALEQHLGVCQRCCGELEFSRQLRERISAAGDERIPPTVRAKLDEIISAPEGDRP